MELAGWAEVVARERLSGVLPDRWAHVHSVAAQARRIAAVVAPDGDLLVAAGFLHDVGYAPALVATGFHPLDGARYLRGIGAPARLCGLVAHHSSAGCEARRRGLAGMLAEFDDEPTPVRDALWYCDMVTGPYGQRVTFEERIVEIQRRYGPGHLVARSVRAASEELAGAVARTEQRLARAGLC